MGVPAPSNQIDPVPKAPFFDYVMSGLRVRSVVQMPSAILAEANSSDGVPDVVITLGPVPDHLEAPDKAGADWESGGGAFLLRLRGVMRVLVRDGRSIEVAPDPGCDPGDLVLYLLGTCFAVLLQQRGRVVLHASAVAVGDRAMLFCGASGMGKSTMAAMLGERGYPLLNDDVCNLSPEADGNYSVYPDGRMLKLWARSVDHLQWTADETARVRHDSAKYYMAPASVDLTPRRVGGVYMLHAAEAGQAPTLTPLNVAEAMAELMLNAYRPRLVHAMDMKPAYFHASVGIQRNAGVFRLSRPMDFARAGEALDLLEKQWATAKSEEIATSTML